VEPLSAGRPRRRSDKWQTHPKPSKAAGPTQRACHLSCHASGLRLPVPKDAPARVCPVCERFAHRVGVASFLLDS